MAIDPSAKVEGEIKSSSRLRDGDGDTDDDDDLF